MKRLIIGFILSCVCAHIAIASKALNPRIVLNSIKQIQKTERHGDELYLSVTSFPSHADASHKRYPTHPLFWPGRHLDKIKNLEVWQGEVPINKGVRLLISLIEQDSPPWDIDDEIGSVDLRLKNNNGKLELEWQHPNKNDSQKVAVKSLDKDILIEFSGQGQSYQVSLKVVKS